MKKLTAVLLTLVLLFSVFSPGAEAHWYQSGAKTLLLILRDEPGEYDLRTKDGIRDYILSCELPEDWREGEIGLLAGIVESAEQIYDAGEDGYRVVRISISEGREDLSFELGYLLEMNEAVVDIFSADHVFDEKDEARLFAFGDYRNRGYNVRISAKNCNYEQLEIRIFYNGDTLEFSSLTPNATAYGSLPFFLYEYGDGPVCVEGPEPEKYPTRCVTVKVSPLGCGRLDGDLFYADFTLKRAGMMNIGVDAILTKTDGTQEQIIPTSRFNRTVRGPYPLETGGPAVDVAVSGQRFCAMRNPFFERNQNGFFNVSYDLYKKHLRPKLLENENYKKETEFEDAGMNRFVTVIFRDPGEIKEQMGTVLPDNAAAAAFLGKDALETVYVAQDVPAAVILTDGKAETLRRILENKNVEYITDPFRMYYEGYYPDDGSSVSAEWFCTAKKARELLRVAAGLDDLPEDLKAQLKFCVFCDFDRDNRLTSADARELLRMAARIDDPRDYSVSFGWEWELYVNSDLSGRAR